MTSAWWSPPSPAGRVSTRPPAYQDRAQAGRVLADVVRPHLSGWPEPALVLGLPRGGVPVAAEVARALALPLDVLVVRKLGLPGQEELAMGAVASGGVRVLNPEVVAWVDDDVLEAATARQRAEVEARERAFRGGRPPLDLRGRCALLVDDGLATGATMRAAVQAARLLGAARVVVAVPVGAADTLRRLEREADAVLCPLVPRDFMAVGMWYEQFTQVEDAQVRALLARFERGEVQQEGEEEGAP